MNVFFVSGFKKICFSNIIYRKNGEDLEWSGLEGEGVN